MLQIRATLRLKYRLNGICKRSKDAAPGISKSKNPNSRRDRLTRQMRRLVRWLHILLQLPITAVSPNSQSHQIGELEKQYTLKTKYWTEIHTVVSKHTNATNTVQRKKDCARWYSKLTSALTATGMEKLTLSLRLGLRRATASYHPRQRRKSTQEKTTTNPQCA